jgi:hypothetical protein
VTEGENKWEVKGMGRRLENSEKTGRSEEKLSKKRRGKRSSEVRGKEEEASNEWGRWQTGSEK